jgi:adenylate cyclase
MGTHATVIFSDLTGSTAVFEALGNQKATLAVTRLTQLMGHACELHKGRVVKTLGDGVLAVFTRESDAVDAMVDLMRQHRTRTAQWPPNLLMQIKVGMASGEIVLVDDDCYGEAVNLASRLCDLSSPGEVWATRAVVEPVQPSHGVRFRSLGSISIRGLSEPREVCQIDWDPVDATDMMTLPAPLGGFEARARVDPILGLIKLSWLDVNAAFRSSQMPIHLGRLSDVEFAVNDARVSRRHARIDWVDNNFVLTDLSSYGTWVRFSGGSSELALRRSECVLHGQGEISLGAPFTDFTAPTVSFTLSDGGVALAHQRKA